MLAKFVAARFCRTVVTITKIVYVVKACGRLMMNRR